MAQAIRTLTVEQGIQPSDFALVAFGGAGPMHAVFLAQELEIGEVIVPRFPGAFSAWGMLETEIRRDFSRSFYVSASDANLRALADLLRGLEEEGRAALEEEGIPGAAFRVEHSLDVRYEAQEYTLQIPIESADDPVSDGFVDRLAGRFHEAHDTRFGHSNPGAPVELVVARTAAFGDLGRAAPERHVDTGAEAGAHIRETVFGRRRWEATVVDRQTLSTGARLEGPAIIDEATATTVVPPGCSLVVDEFGSLIITVGKDA